jgi:hypothetical protein
VILQLAVDTSSNDTGMGIGIVMLILAALFFWDAGGKK